MRTILALLVALLVLSWTAGVGLAQTATPTPAPVKLEIVRIDWRPDSPRAGEPVIFAVTYRNAGEQTIAKDQTVMMTLMVQSAGAAVCEQTEAAVGVSKLRPDDENTHDFAPCFLNLEGGYTAEVQVDGATGEQETAGAVEITSTPAPRSLSVGTAASALPSEWTNVFAGLGMFAAVMAIVAAGTEVLIDSLKVGLGMKSKVTSLEALAKLESLLPGQLASLGVEATALEQFQELKRSLNSVLEKPVKWVSDVRGAADAIQKGAFREAYTHVTNLLPRPGQVVAADKLAELKEGAKAALGALDTLQAKLGLHPAFVAPMKRDLGQAIDSVTIGTSAEFLERLFKRLQDPGWPQQITEGWLEKERNTLLTKGREAVMSLFEKDVRPELLGMGMESAVVDDIHLKLSLALSFSESKAMAATTTYLQSLENLLVSVEERRAAMQSPTRKLWRRLREASHGLATVVVAAGLTLAAFLAWVELHLIWTIRSFSLPLAIGLNTLLALLATYALLRLAAWKGGQVFRANVSANRAITDLQKVEVFWNWLRGDEQLDPAHFGRPRPAAGKNGRDELTVATAAEVVMARSDQQEDEESSRLRWLRVISVMVGFILAYALQVDAAVLLDAVVPGVADSINSVFSFGGEQLHAFWPRLPAGLDLTAGMILTGLAASAGSAYWHDQLDRLQASKSTLEKVATLVRQAKGK